MTPLRAKYIRDLAIRGRAIRTQQAYTAFVVDLARTIGVNVPLKPFLGKVKAAEDCAHSKSWRTVYAKRAKEVAPASWSAAALCRFGLVGGCIGGPHSALRRFGQQSPAPRHPQGSCLPGNTPPPPGPEHHRLRAGAGQARSGLSTLRQSQATLGGVHRPARPLAFLRDGQTRFLMNGSLHFSHRRCRAEFFDSAVAAAFCPPLPQSPAAATIAAFWHGRQNQSARIQTGSRLIAVVSWNAGALPTPPRRSFPTVGGVTFPYSLRLTRLRPTVE